MATATSKLNIIVDVIGDQATRGLSGIQSAIAKIGLATAALAGAAMTAKKAWDFTKEGAQLQLVETQFNNVATAAGYMSDVLLSRMRQATDGLVSDAQLMQSGLDIIELGLADNEDGVVRLATVVSRLGLDMQQVILTFANNSEMRLDALGLSVEGVRERVEELNATGFEGDAFDQAVLEGLEQRMKVLGDTSETAAGKMQRFEVQWSNLMDSLKMKAVDAVLPTLDAAIAIQDVSAALEAGLISQDEYNRIQTLGRYSSEAYAKALDDIQQRQDLVNGYVQSARVLQDQYNDSIDVGANANNIYADRARNSAQANAEAGAAAAAYNRTQQGLNDTLEESARQWSTINTNISGTIDALQERLEFIAGGGGALLDLEEAARRAMDEGNWSGAQIALDNAKEGATLFDLELGKITTDEAEAELVAMGFPLDEAKRKVDLVQQGLWSLTAQDYSVIINVIENRISGTKSTYSGDINYNPPTYDTGGGGSEYASGTGGWLTVPGSVGQPFPVTLHGGEKFNVIPAGESGGGGNVVNWYGDAVFTTSGEALDFISSMQRNAARNAASAAAGGGYIG